MRRSALTAIILGALMCLSSNSFAGDFKLCNNSANMNVSIFQLEAVSKQNSYSSNWLKNPLGAGRCVELSFSNSNHPCEIRFKVIFTDGTVASGIKNVCTSRQVNVRR